MDVIRPLHKTSLAAPLIALWLLILPLSPALAKQVNPDTLDSLDIRFKEYSRNFYRQVVKQNLLPLHKYQTIADLKNKVDGLVQSGKIVEAIAHIHLNFNVIRNNIDAVQAVPLAELLLDNNDWHGAKQIFDTARDEGGKSAVSNISFIFAKYFMKRKKWQKALEHLQDVINELSVENANYARLMVGTILQHQKKHREAVKFYQKISKSSKYYPSAVLNTAVAYIRQDWWTDAYILIDDLVKNHHKPVSDHMVDRLYLVLGYALMRKEYFRNSRDAFRNVGLNSPYTNKALLGIALTAANQEDFIGALNAITILKGKKNTDLSVDEAYLLLPYTYGKLKQNLTATSAYNDAIKYYQSRIAELQQIAVSKTNLLSKTSVLPNKTSLIIGQNHFDYSKYYPKSFFDNHRHLESFKKISNESKTLGNSYKMLINEHNMILTEISQHLLAERIDQLESYLNQSRYGLARLYDSSLVSTK